MNFKHSLINFEIRLVISFITFKLQWIFTHYYMCHTFNDVIDDIVLMTVVKKRMTTMANE